MNQITNHDEYRAVIARIKELSFPEENGFSTMEIQMLKNLAIAYEQGKYDFTIYPRDSSQFSLGT